MGKDYSTIIVSSPSSLIPAQAHFKQKPSTQGDTPGMNRDRQAKTVTKQALWGTPFQSTGQDRRAYHKPQTILQLPPCLPADLSERTRVAGV